MRRRRLWPATNSTVTGPRTIEEAKEWYAEGVSTLVELEEDLDRLVTVEGGEDE